MSANVTNSDRSRSSRLTRWVAKPAALLLVLLVAAELAFRLGGLIILAQRARAVGRESPSATGAIPVLSVGESTTFGLGVEPQWAYPSVLVRLLEEAYPGKTFASINRGVPGLTSTAMVRTFSAKLVAIRPRLVTIKAGVNDYSRRLNWLAENDEAFLPEWLQAGVSSLRLYKVARFIIERRRLTIRTLHGEITYDNGTGSDYKSLLVEQPRDERKIAEVTAQLKSNLLEMVAQCKTSGIAVVLVGYIHPHSPHAWMLEEVAEETGVLYVSTTISQYDPDFFIADGWHPSVRGHRHIAERIAREVVRTGLVAGFASNRETEASGMITARPNPVPASRTGKMEIPGTKKH